MAPPIYFFPMSCFILYLVEHFMHVWTIKISCLSSIPTLLQIFAPWRPLWSRVSKLVARSALGNQTREKAFANVGRGLRATSWTQLLGLEGGRDTDTGCLSSSLLFLDSLTPGEGHSQRKYRVGPSRVLGPAQETKFSKYKISTGYGVWCGTKMVISISILDKKQEFLMEKQCLKWVLRDDKELSRYV